MEKLCERAYTHFIGQTDDRPLEDSWTALVLRTILEPARWQELRVQNAGDRLSSTKSRTGISLHGTKRARENWQAATK